MHKFEVRKGVIVDVVEGSYNKAIELGWKEIKEVKEAKQKAKPKAKKRGNSTDGN